MIGRAHLHLGQVWLDVAHKLDGLPATAAASTTTNAKKRAGMPASESPRKIGVSKHTNDLHRHIKTLGRPATVLDTDAVRSLLRAAIELEGDQAAFARRHGLQRSNLNGILNGKRPVSASVVKALGLRRVYIAAQDDE